MILHGKVWLRSSAVNLIVALKLALACSGLIKSGNLVLCVGVWLLCSEVNLTLAVQLALASLGLVDFRAVVVRGEVWLPCSGVKLTAVLEVTRACSGPDQIQGLDSACWSRVGWFFETGSAVSWIDRSQNHTGSGLGGVALSERAPLDSHPAVSWSLFWVDRVQGLGSVCLSVPLLWKAPFQCCDEPGSSVLPTDWK